MIEIEKAISEKEAFMEAFMRMSPKERRIFMKEGEAALDRMLKETSEDRRGTSEFRRGIQDVG